MCSAAAGEQLRRLHTIVGTGYGFLNDGSGLRSTWAQVLLEPIESLEPLTAAGVVPADLARRLRESLPAAINQLEPGPPVLIHGDLHPRHVYASDGQLTGIIDWGDTAFGDPLFEFGRFSRAGATATDALLSGYCLERTPEVAWKITLYRIVWSVMALNWEFAAGGDWFAGHIAAITDGLGELELNG